MTIDNPDSFVNIAGEDVNLNYLFFKQTADGYGNIYDVLVDTDTTPIRVFKQQTDFTSFTTWPDGTEISDGDLVYFYDSTEDRVMSVNTTNNTLELQRDYRAAIGRRNLKFQYIHNASVTTQHLEPIY